ncbi:MAG: hypothetical protein DSY82_02075 [Flavobacteriia bacterium]|nr:MAG: hypothetical protein DSY82_02075 [Flavobacteriia bacterium]
MLLARYISDLLYRHECVIIPDFGGFVTNIKSAKINTFSNTFYPPYKQISFNAFLKENDGLLANYITSVDHITYEAALNFIKFEVEEWKKRLKYEDLILEKLGYLSLNNNKIIFEPDTNVNYLTSSFGLSNVVSPEIKREIYQKKAEESEEKAPVYLNHEKRSTPEYLKYAAIFLLGISALGIGNRLYNNYHSKKMVAVAEKYQEEVERKIENATFVISKPLPIIDLQITTTSTSSKSYHVIAGAFRFPENAEKKMRQLEKEGYNSRILGVNKWGLTIVTFDSFDNERDAINSLNRIRRNKDKKAWLLVQKF